MPMALYSGNVKTNRNLALAILLLLIAQTLGIVQALGFNLATLGIAGYGILTILMTLGLGWVAYGLWKNRV